MGRKGQAGVLDSFQLQRGIEARWWDKAGMFGSEEEGENRFATETWES